MMRLRKMTALLFMIFGILFGSAAAFPGAALACEYHAHNHQEMIDAINKANARCGSAMIRLQASFTTESGTFTDSYNQGKNAFPVIRTYISLDGKDNAIHKGSGGDYRFFSVGSGGTLFINNITLEGGGNVPKGGAILAYGDKGDVHLKITKSTLSNNVAGNDGGAIQIASVKDFSTKVRIEDSKLNHNSAGADNKSEGEGGAIYSDGRAGGNLNLTLVRTDISNNIAGKEGGALRFLSSGSRNVVLTVDNSNFANNSTPQCVFHNSLTIAGSNRATDDTCGESVVVASCHFTPGTVEALIEAINRANDEVACPGEDIIVLTADINPTQGYEGGQTAFPAITSVITIDGSDPVSKRPSATIERKPDAPQFRFFYVDGLNGAKGDLTLRKLHLTGGGGDMAGGAVLADGHSAGNHAAVASHDTTYERNIGDNGGAVAVMGYDGGSAIAYFRGNVFTHNKGLYGGAVYVGGFEKGIASAIFDGGAFTGNEAVVNGGAIYNNGQGAGSHAYLHVDRMAFTENTSERVSVIVNDADRGGFAELGMTHTTLASNVSRAPGGVLDIVAYVDGGGKVDFSVDDTRRLDVAGYTCFTGAESVKLTAVRCP